MNFEDIKDKSPADLTVTEIAWLKSELAFARELQRQAVERARHAGDVLVIDACGIEQVMSWGALGFGDVGSQPPRSFIMPVRRRLEPFFQAESMPVAEMMQRREFVLARRLSWNGAYVYEEKV